MVSAVSGVGSMVVMATTVVLISSPAAHLIWSRSCFLDKSKDLQKSPAAIEIEV